MSNDDAIRLQLFHREHGSKSLYPIFQLSPNELHSNDYQHWLSEKRALVLGDIEDCHWIKSCSGGYVTEVIFHRDGRLTEYRLFDRFETQGNWKLDNGILKAEIIKAENRYTFNVIGNANINIHSAVELKNNELHSYLKLAQVKG
ncbi:hypothetical protein LNL84_04675 [Vibrio sp. ZSDZ34]|uniref:Uncharacterized protein n=1 Tax=Vibrio gelatinilyticus TaxID=2893468 RepID=A0A9X2AXZ9_9VIBR|nr:hypothetical protein [Vibrio gelatinilyticus]MCJ2376123.1 hypothetical protein [Vibrio gelatinilyticus]